ncbi:MAG: hypothetical protein ABJA80_05470 [bacterium]
MSTIRFLCLLGAAASMAACADSIKPGASVPMSLSFATAPSSGASASASLSPVSPQFDVTTTEGANTLVITKAQVVVARAELQLSGATCASEADAGDDADEAHGANDGEHSDCESLELAPSVVDVPVTSAVVSTLNVMIPAGTYSALEAKIRPVRANNGHGSAAFLTANPTLAGVSVRVEGTYNGTSFVYTGSPEAKLETEFSPPMVVGASPVNLTVNVDISTWFRSASGALIDPATANAGGANANVVASNIKRSFRAFRDDDRNGHDDKDDQRGH